MLVVQSLRVGGAETMVENLAYALRRQGCAVVVVVLQPGETMITKRLRDNGIDLPEVRNWRWEDSEAPAAE